MPQTTTRRPAEEDDDIMEEAEESVESTSTAAERRQTERKDRPTPSQREETVRGGNFLTRFVQNVRLYFRETWAELQKVTWLSREDTTRLTRIVLVVVAVSAIVLGGIGFVFALLTQLLAAQGTGVLAGAFTIALIVVVAGLWLFRDQVFGNRFE